MFFKREKYKFNSKTLQYEKLKFSYKKFFYNFFKQSFLSILCGVVFVVLFSIFYPIYKKSSIERENIFLKEKVFDLSKQINLINIELDKYSSRDKDIYRSLMGLPEDKVNEVLRESGIGGRNTYPDLDGYSNSELVKQTFKNLEKIKTKLKAQSKSQQELISEVVQNKEYFEKAPVLQPIKNNDLIRISSNFGYRLHPILGIMQLHSGLDLLANTGTKVYASGSGVVTTAGSIASTGYGIEVIIDHEVRNLSSRYAHLSKLHVKKGDKVLRGQLIGEVGSTGLSTAPHLHYEILVNGNAVNPLRYMFAPSVETYETMVKEAKYKSSSMD